MAGGAERQGGQPQPAERGISRRTLLKIGIVSGTVGAVSGIGALIDSGIGAQARTEAQTEVDQSGEYPQPTQKALESAQAIGVQPVSDALKHHTPEEVCQEARTLDQQNKREQAIDKRAYAKTGLFWRIRRFGEDAGMYLGGSIAAGTAVTEVIVAATADRTL